MLLRRLLHPSHHLRRGLQTLTTTTNAVAAPSSSSPLSAPLPFHRLPARFLSPRLLSTSGGDDDTRKPWAFTPEGDPDPFADVDPAATGAGEAPLGSSAVVEDTWAKDFLAEDSEKGDVFEEIYKETAAAAPTARKAASAEVADTWTIDLEDEKDDLFAAIEFYFGYFPFGENLGRQGDWAALMCSICYSDPSEPTAPASPELRSFIGCCLQKNPAKRLSAAQLLQHPFVAGPRLLPPPS